MSRSSPARRKRHRELTEALDQFDPFPKGGPGPIFEQLSEVLEATSVLTYAPEPTAVGWNLEFVHWVGRDAARRVRGFRDLVRSMSSDGAGFAAYDPFAVEGWQRNRVVSVADLLAHDPSANTPHQRVQRAIGAQGEDQIRVLICRGPRLLAWLGALREVPFSREEQSLLQSLVPGMAKRLQWLQEKEAPEACALIEGVLEGFPEPAVLISQHGRVEYANRAALRVFDSAWERARFRSLCQAALAGGNVAALEVTTITTTGYPVYRLVRWIDATLRKRVCLSLAKSRWQLSARHSAVLERLSEGRGNKEIANSMGCSEVTVERYLTLLFRKSGTASRTALLARLHELA